MPERLPPDRPRPQAVPLLHLEVVTPHARAYKDDVDEVIAPAARGEVGVLPFHRPLLSSMVAGSLRWRHGTEWTEVVVGPGFLEVGPDKVTLLCEKLVPAKEIDAEEAKRDLAEADAALLAFDGDPSGAAHQELERARAWAVARLDIVSRRKFEL